MNAPKLLLPEDPLERLNYFNSQRLEAIDFRLEQAYHMRVRRWLNRSLYSPGIGAGLEVTPDPVDTHAVIVSPGLALDWLGRETILLNERKVMACGTPRRADGVTFGNYLVIAYREEKVAPQSDGCRVQGVYDNGLDACGCTRSPLETNSCNGGCGCSGCKSGKGCQCGATGSEAYAWGAPSRIRSEPLLMFQDTWPTESSGKILLAQIELDAQCKVINVKSGMRRYASASKPPTTIPISLEGEKDIDKDNSKVLQFHIEGGYPDTALLYLQGFKFSTLYYTEMGKHTHVITSTSDKVKKDLRHTHEVDSFKLKDSGAHNHVLHTESDGSTSLETADADYVPTTSFIDGVGDHGHGLEELKLNEKLNEWEHDHKITSSAANTGVTDISTRTGTSRSHLKALQVSFDGTDITAQILVQLEALNPGNWAELGDGGSNHELVKNGTGPIDLRQIDGVDLSPGTSHTLIFAVASGGGQLHYNLYVS
ncbi:hypothetical protein [Lysobacter sp. CFH 32150]|uniref:hypothetical protein n=1 Tax=Lysobacter sp. CFH 32150 TaxID=2927128 RepID=UPI001FA7DA82|nr:hypothetical protein [Lysobacter sp. CFH 32150]MCI4567330.1 hypothetical protein [Lysobacter sp. CFH 32150]